MGLTCFVRSSFCRRRVRRENGAGGASNRRLLIEFEAAAKAENQSSKFAENGTHNIFISNRFNYIVFIFRFFGKILLLKISLDIKSSFSGTINIK